MVCNFLKGYCCANISFVSKSFNFTNFVPFISHEIPIYLNSPLNLCPAVACHEVSTLPWVLLAIQFR